MPSTTRTLASALAGAATAAAHGYVSNVVINGVSYSGYDVTSFPYQNDAPVVIGWSSSATDLGFVAPDAFSDPDIICHRDSENAQGHAQVAAGDSIYLQWNTWPESHHGPVIDYLASCGDSGCESVDKTTLEFFKISEVGLVDGSAAPGTYGDDQLIANSLGWMVKVPENIAPGNYVLRHEIIALHSAGEENGAQNYPQCFNLEVTGSGSQQPQGVLGTELYTSTDEGILFNIYTPLDSYPIPGPALIEGASAVSQATSAIQETGTATQGTGSGPTNAPEPTSTNGGSDPTATPAPTTTPTPAPAPSSSAGSTPSATTPTSQEPEPTTTPPDTCALKKRKTKKVRRHARDVKNRNVAPIRL